MRTSPATSRRRTRRRYKPRAERAASACTAFRISRRIKPLNGRTRIQYKRNFLFTPRLPQSTRVSVLSTEPFGCGAIEKLQIATAASAGTGRRNASFGAMRAPPDALQNWPIKPKTISCGGDSARRVNPRALRADSVNGGRPRSGEQSGSRVTTAGIPRRKSRARTSLELSKSARISAVCAWSGLPGITMLCRSTTSYRGMKSSINRARLRARSRS